MPKITLTNTETGKDEDFEPVDAREILSQKDTIYAVPDETRELIGQRFDPARIGPDGINVPQLQGQDAEMQTGLPIEKYGREAVVKAIPGAPESARHVAAADVTAADIKADVDTVAGLKDALDAKGVEYPSNAKKADLQRLLAKS